MLSVLLLLAQTDDTLLRNALEKTAAEQRCSDSATARTITVCGRRTADRYRVPLTVVEPGDPAHRSVSEERQALLHRTTPIQDQSLFLVGGGMAGATMTTGGRNGSTSLRPLAE